MWITKNSAEIVWVKPAPLSVSVQAARDIQHARFTKSQSTDVICNVDIGIGEIRQFCRLQDEGGVLSQVEA